MQTRSFRDLRRFIYETAKEALKTEAVNVRDTGLGTWTGDEQRLGTDGGNETNGYGFRTGLYRKAFAGVTTLAPIQVERDWGKGFDRSPVFLPKDVLPAVKHGQAIIDGENVTVDPGTRAALVRRWAPVAASWVTSPVDVVAVPQSSSNLATLWGKALAQVLGARFVPVGFLKTPREADLVDPLPATVTPKQADKLRKELERMKRADEPKIHTHFHARDRHLVTKWMKPTDDFLLDVIESGRDSVRVLLADDIVTSGSSAAEMKRALEREDSEFFSVVGCLALFKLQG